MYMYVLIYILAIRCKKGAEVGAPLSPHELSRRFINIYR